MPNTTIIYRITNMINGMIYIGKTDIGMDERFNKHIQNSKRGETYLYRSMRKYGIENFKIEHIDDCHISISSETEINWILSEDSLIPNGYNMTEGGTGGDTSMSENYIIGMRNRRSMAGENNPMFGKESAMKGKTHKSSTIEKMSSKRKDYWTDDKKDIASNRIKGDKNPMKGKTPTNAIPIEIDGIKYNSIAHAMRELDISSTKVKRLCKK